MSVTHRAVEITEDGIVTQGDGNPSTDQAAGYPLVHPDDVAGEVVTVGGAPLRIPQLGVGITLLRSYWYLMVALLAGVFLRNFAETARNRDRDSVLRSREVILTTAVVAVVIAVALMSIAATQQTTVYQVTAEDTESVQTLTVGVDRTEAMTVRLAKTPVSYAIIDTDGMTITNATVTDEPRGGPEVDDTGRFGCVSTSTLRHFPGAWSPRCTMSTPSLRRCRPSWYRLGCCTGVTGYSSTRQCRSGGRAVADSSASVVTDETPSTLTWR